MSRKLAFIALTTITLFAAVSKAQNIFPSTGNMGVGTTTPGASLEVYNGNILIKSLEQVNNSSKILIGSSIWESNYTDFGVSLRGITEDWGNNRYGMQFFTMGSYLTGQTEKLRIQGNGNVGIGTISPREKLDVSGNVLWSGHKAGNPRALSLGYSGGNYGGIGYNIDFTSSTGLFNKPLDDQSSYLEFNNGGFHFYGTSNNVAANGINLLGGGYNLNLMAVMTNTGNFGIGITSPSEKLAVNGNIRAREIKVETNNWPDYVFEKGYQVGTLEDLESYIKQYKHLPEIPSAKDAETNGIALGEINKLLLKKIEELTLHLIEQDKQLQSFAENQEILLDFMKSVQSKKTSQTKR